VAQVLAEGEAKFGLIADIVWESSFDAGAFFEHEIE
jgi:hypothetical protein